MCQFGFLYALRLRGRLRGFLPSCVGYVATIDERGGAENTATGYKFEAVCRFPHRVKDFGFSAAETPWVFARLRAYSSDALICSRAAVHIGPIATGVATACYTGNGRADLDSWSLVTDVSLRRAGFIHVVSPVLTGRFRRMKRIPLTRCCAQRIWCSTSESSIGVLRSGATLRCPRSRGEPDHWNPDETPQ